jgi:hypothetical protein
MTVPVEPAGAVLKLLADDVLEVCRPERVVPAPVVEVVHPSRRLEAGWASAVGFEAGDQGRGPGSPRLVGVEGDDEGTPEGCEPAGDCVVAGGSAEDGGASEAGREAVRASIGPRSR